MKEGWPQHKLVCQPSHLGIRSPTDEEYEKARSIAVKAAMALSAVSVFIQISIGL